MDTLETLLKVAQSRLDDVSREAGAAAERMASLNEALVAMEQSQAHARAHSDVDVSLLVVAGDYLGRRRAEKERLEDEIAAQRDVVDEIRARLTMAYREKSKFEQLLAREQAREAQAEAAREQKQMDEAALRLANRR